MPVGPVKNRGVSAKVFEYLEKNRGLVVHANDMARDLGFDANVIRHSVNNLRKSHNIEILVRGSSWRYGGKTPQSSLFELIGRSRQGDLILQDEEGTLFRAREIE